jgi:hypothetical protein
MFGPSKSASSDLGLKNPKNPGVGQQATVLPESVKAASDLSSPLYNTGSMSSSANSNAVGPTNPIAIANSNSPLLWQQQVDQFVSDYNAGGYGGYDMGGYGGTEDPVTRRYNQGIGNGTEGGDPGKSQPHGGSNDEDGRTPGQRWIPKIFSGLGF